MYVNRKLDVIKKEYKEAIYLLKQVMKATNDKKEADEAIFSLSNIYLHMEEYNLAQETINKLIINENIRPHRFLAALEYEKGDMDKAKKSYQKLLYGDFTDIIDNGFIKPLSVYFTKQLVNSAGFPGFLSI